MRKLLNLMLWAAVMLICEACEHKELCYHHPHKIDIYVEFDWCNAPEANPEGMCVFFYPETGGEPRRYDFVGTQGGKITIAAGKYKVLCYNNDTEAVQFNNIKSFGSHEGYTREGDILEPIYGSGYYRSNTPKAADAKDQTVVICPDMLWVGTALDVNITEHGMSYTCVPEKDKDNVQFVESSDQIITLYPCEQVCTYSYEINDVENIDGVSQMCATLSGLAGSQFLATGELGTESKTLTFEAKPNRQDAQITGEFYTFGHNLQNNDPHLMVLYVIFNSGKKLYYTFDVTEQVHNAENPRRVHIVINGLGLPESVEDTGSGMDVAVDDWGTEYIEMPV